MQQYTIVRLKVYNPKRKGVTQASLHSTTTTQDAQTSTTS